MKMHEALSLLYFASFQIQIYMSFFLNKNEKFTRELLVIYLNLYHVPCSPFVAIKPL